MEVWGNQPLARYISAPAELISEEMWRITQQGNRFSQWISTSPDEALKTLRQHAVKRLGSFKIKDTDHLVTFRNATMLTNGLDYAKDDDYEKHWRDLLKEKIEKHQRRWNQLQGGWQETINVTAYVVNIEDAAGPQKSGLLNSLVKKSQTGTATLEIWEYLAVRAVIEYKWRHWAHKYFIIEIFLYTGWLLCFSMFLILYAENNTCVDFHDLNYHDKVRRFVEYLLNGLSCLFMMPFIIVEINTMKHYGKSWFQMWNILDSKTYVLQTVVSVLHFANYELCSIGYNTVLAIYCITLYTKAQYFARLVSDGSSFIELLSRVAVKVRYFFYFIALTMIASALALTVLYKENKHGKGQDVAEDDFGQPFRSLVTIFAVLLGDFDPEYVFGSTNRTTKGIFFITFQIVMSITGLNLLIAMMTQSHSEVMEQDQNMRTMARAQAMDELEISLPKRFHPELPSFCHFLLVDKDNNDIAAQTSDITDLIKGNSDATDQLPHSEIDELRVEINELKELVRAALKAADKAH